ncbi:redoxin domain-containing protein [Paenibacillus caseinilyticus]|uniref:Thiol-disulfide oxidoreductase n=1 Tax=Paenibacillus mucilaginosus K02 TaxID=997761 RepID=I0BI38_9BACL|nr:redoxin domain-containing protein [Paenibacillus mucilaginosus]AFH62035.1 thiol-disulfide oxidoreductase [Paenibacillus mucilaginosus K02]
MGKHRQWIQISILAVILVIGGLTLANNLFSKEEKPVAGSAAPNFKLLGLDGKTHNLSDYEGKPVVVNFWGTFCEPCRNEMPALERQHAKWGDKVAILGLNLDEPKVAVENYVKETGVTFPILFDKEETMRKRFGVKEYPTTFFLNGDGTIAAIKVGEMDEPFIERTLTSLLQQQ